MELRLNWTPESKEFQSKNSTDINLLSCFIQSLYWRYLLNLVAEVSLKTWVPTSTTSTDVCLVDHAKASFCWSSNSSPRQPGLSLQVFSKQRGAVLLPQSLQGRRAGTDNLFQKDDGSNLNLKLWIFCLRGTEWDLGVLLSVKDDGVFWAQALGERLGSTQPAPQAARTGAAIFARSLGICASVNTAPDSCLTGVPRWQAQAT